MMTDTELKVMGVRVLVESLGEVEAERFISLLLREPFDYTTWQRSLLVDRSVEEISGSAMAFRKDHDRSE